MKTAIKLFGIIALVAIIGFSMVACGGGDDDSDNTPGGNTPGETPNQPTQDINLNGTVWKTGEYQFTEDGGVKTGTSTMTFAASTALISTAYGGYSTSDCTYTVKGNTVTIKLDIVTISFVITGNTFVFPMSGFRTSDGQTVSFTGSWPLFKGQTFVKQ